MVLLLRSWTSCLDVGFRAFLDPGLDSWNVTHALVMFHQLWEFAELVRNVWFTMPQKVVAEVEECDIGIGQLRKIRK